MMADKPKNKLSADKIMKSDNFGHNGKLKTGKDSYPCDNYIQAISIKETLEGITGKEYDIEKNGLFGWKVVTHR